MLDKLEYNEIIKLVSNYCKTYIGKVSVLNLKPCFDFEGVSRLLTETAEAMDISIRKSNILLKKSNTYIDKYNTV